MTSVLQLGDVGKSYPGSGAVLRSVNLDLVPGQMVSIVGRSGSGKSTLLNILGLLDRPGTGTYLLDGRDMTVANDRQRDAARARHLGFVFQAYHLLATRSVLENVELGSAYSGTPRRQRQAEARRLLGRVGLDSRAADKPTHLSGGERQRVAIARALMGGPSVLLCDEPTGNLDLSNASQVLGLLREATGHGVAVVVVTHDMDVAAAADRCLQVLDGQLVETVDG